MRILPYFPALLFFLWAVPVQAALFDNLFGSSHEDVRPENGMIQVDAGKLEKGQAKHYRYREGAVTVRFFVVRDREGVVRAAVDACEQCRNEGKGYKLQGGAMLCVNCGQKFALNRIGMVKGGCNPHPFAYVLKDDILSVAAKSLLAGGVNYFPENK